MGRKSLRFLLVLSLSLGLMSPVYAEKIVLELWQHPHPPREQAFNKVVEWFNQQNNDVEVVVSYPPDFGDKLVVTIAGQTGVGPDIVHMHPIDLPRFADSIVVPLSEDIFPLSRVSKEIVPSAVDPWVFNGKLYGLQYAINPHVLYYNTDLFLAAGLDPNEPPTTWDQLVEYGRKLVRRDGNGDSVQSGFAVNGGQPVWMWQNLVLNTGGSIFDEQGMPSFHTTTGKEALQLMYDAIHESRIYDLDMGDAGLLFAEQRLGMFQIYVGFGLWLQQFYPDVNFRSAPIPVKDAGIDPKFVTYGDWGLAITAQAERRGKEVMDAAHRFLEFYATVDAQVELLGVEGAPVRYEVFEDPRTHEWLDRLPYYEPAVAMAPNGVFPAHQLDSGRVGSAWVKMINDALRGVVSINEAVEEAARAIAIVQSGE